MGKSRLRLTIYKTENQEVVRIEVLGGQNILFEELKKDPSILYDEKSAIWYIKTAEFNLGSFYNKYHSYGYIDYSAIKGKIRSSEKKNFALKKEKIKVPEESQKCIDRFVMWMEQKRYARNTIDSYTNALLHFFHYYSDKKVSEIEASDIETFNHAYIIKKGYSPSYQNQIISAIKLFYSKMLQIKFEMENLERPRRGRPLPKVIPKEIIKKMLEGATNLKHKTALSVVYSLGLRRSELLNLKLEDIDSTDNIVMIKNAKGQKDRILPVPDKLMALIKTYYRSCKPKIYLIEGSKRGKPYSATSLQNIVKDNLSKFYKSHNFTPHCLRHSYATHLLDSGVDIRYIQELLGHKSSRTTEIYTHVSMRSLRTIKNPLDDMDI